MCFQQLSPEEELQQQSMVKNMPLHQPMNTSCCVKCLLYVCGKDVSFSYVNLSLCSTDGLFTGLEGCQLPCLVPGCYDLSLAISSQCDQFTRKYHILQHGLT